MTSKITFFYGFITGIMFVLVVMFVLYIQSIVVIDAFSLPIGIGDSRKDILYFLDRYSQGVVGEKYTKAFTCKVSPTELSDMFFWNTYDPSNRTSVVILDYSYNASSDDYFVTRIFRPDLSCGRIP
jgi:hypothetical protein